MVTWSELLFQVGVLFVLALPIACCSWCITQEEIFRGLRESMKTWSETKGGPLRTKLAYLFQCGFCCSHYVCAVFILLVSDFRLLLSDWRGYVLAGFSLVAIANVYMTVYHILRQVLKRKGLANKILEIRFTELEARARASAEREAQKPFQGPVGVSSTTGSPKERITA